MTGPFVACGFLVPFFTVGTFYFGPYISIQYAAMAIAALLGLLAELLRQRPYASRGMLRFAFGVLLVFLIALAVGLATSPHKMQDIGSKAAIQIAGLVVAILFAVHAALRAAKDSRFTIAVLRAATLALGIVGALGVAQFALANVFDAPSLLRFDWLNTIAGGRIWNDPPQSPLVVRANSIASEPSHFARMMAFALGFAVLRVGMLGPSAQSAIAPIMPRATAYVVLLSVLFASSLLALVEFVVVIAFTYALAARWDASSLARLFIRATPLVAVGALFVSTIGEEVLAKFWSLERLVLPQTDLADAHTVELSALAVLVNRVVMEGNLSLSPMLGGGIGSHPVAYDLLGPGFIAATSGLAGLNAEDASGLLIRLLSETGTLGAILFLSVMLTPIVAALALRGRLGYLTASDRFLVVGLVSSFAATLAACMGRSGSYFDLSLWLLLALTLGTLCRMSSRHGAMDKQSPRAAHRYGHG